MYAGIRRWCNAALAAVMLTGAGMTFVSCDPELHNNPPEMPEMPVGPKDGLANTAVTFTAWARDPDGARVMLRFDWGDGCISDWTRPVDNGTRVSMEHNYFTGGSYGVRVIAMDLSQLESIPSGAAMIRITGTGVAGRGDWWSFGRDAQHTHRSTLAGPVLGDTAWTFQTGGRIFGSPVIGIDGTIYFGSDDFHLYALFPDGRLRWSYNAGSDVVRSTPAIASDGTIYVVSADGLLHAVSPGGARKWVCATAPSSYALSLRSSPAVGLDGTIYACDESGEIFALYPDGTLRWRRGFVGGFFSTPVILRDRTLVVGGDSSHVVSAISAIGDLAWTYGTNGLICSSAAVDAAGTIYIGSDVLYALRGDGVLLWKYQTPAGIISSPAIGADGTVYVTSVDGTLQALTPQGALKWEVKFADHGGECSPAVDASGTVYLGTSEGRVVAVSSGGTILWRADCGGGFDFSSPAIGPNGRLYIGNLNGKLYAIK